MRIGRWRAAPSSETRSRIRPGSDHNPRRSMRVRAGRRRVVAYADVQLVAETRRPHGTCARARAGRVRATLHEPVHGQPSAADGDQLAVGINSASARLAAIESTGMKVGEVGCVR